MTKNMGIGELGNPETVFPRQFRFVLNSDTLNIEYFVKNAEVSYTDQTLHVDLMEFIVKGMDCPVDAWIQDLLSGKTKDNVTLTTLDGCGMPLYKIDFHEVKVAKHKLPFDYASSEIVTHHVQLTFKKSVRTFLYGKEDHEG